MSVSDTGHDWDLVTYKTELCHERRNEFLSDHVPIEIHKAAPDAVGAFNDPPCGARNLIQDRLGLVGSRIHKGDLCIASQVLTN